MKHVHDSDKSLDPSIFQYAAFLHNIEVCMSSIRSELELLPARFLTAEGGGLSAAPCYWTCAVNSPIDRWSSPRASPIHQSRLFCSGPLEP